MTSLQLFVMSDKDADVIGRKEEVVHLLLSPKRNSGVADLCDLEKVASALEIAILRHWDTDSIAVLVSELFEDLAVFRLEIDGVVELI